MKVSSILVLVIVICSSIRRLKKVEYESKFASFVKKYNKKYENALEWAGRYETFKNNLDDIYTHNTYGNSTYTKGITQFADQSAEEWINNHQARGCLHQMKQNKLQKLKNKFKTKKLNTASCTSIDWVTEGAVTPVKNQGQCGSCWSFSTTGAIEGRCKIAKGLLHSLSEQQLVDCAGTYGNNGCNGGLMDLGFEYVQSAGGLCSEDSYPYVAKQQYYSCTSSINTCGSKLDDITGHFDVALHNRGQLEAAICEGPVSIAIEADQSAFQFYTGGVLTTDCGTTIDHGVLLVGMGTDNGIDYWKIKNSWGPQWGEEGYIRISRDGNINNGAGLCGILSSPSYPTC